MKSRLVLRILNPIDSERSWYMLEDFQIKKLKKDILYKTAHDLGITGNIIYKEISSDAEKISDVINDRLKQTINVKAGGNPRPKDLRIIISKEGLIQDKKEIEQDNLILISFKDTDGGWIKASSLCYPVRIVVNSYSPTLLKKVIHDVFLDIYIANSTPIWPIIKKSIDVQGREWLYKEKVKFIINNYGNESAFGVINQDCGYISFSSIARLKNGDLYENTVEIWDEFISKKLIGFSMNPEEIAIDLCSRRQIGGQLKSELKLSSDIEQLQSGSWLLIFTNKYKGKENTFLCDPRLPRPRHGKISFIPAINVDKSIQNMIREEKIIALKFYKA